MQHFTPQEAAAKLLEHIIYHKVADRLGESQADAFISELALIAGGKVRFGALVENH